MGATFINIMVVILKVMAKFRVLSIMRTWPLGGFSLTPRGMLMHQRTSCLKGLGMFWLGFIGSWFAMDSIDVGSGRHVD
jgi:hypothetical protein